MDKQEKRALANRKIQQHRFLIEASARYIRGITDGCFIECGVKHGSSSVIMAKVLDTQGYLFDTWTGFPHFSEVDVIGDKWKKRLKSRVASDGDISQHCANRLKEWKVDHLCEMIQGDICETVPKFIAEHPGLKVAMLHVDTDLYEPAKVALEQFAPFMEETGLIFCHDYNCDRYPGIKRAIDETLGWEWNLHDFANVRRMMDYHSCAISRSDLAKYAEEVDKEGYPSIGNLEEPGW